MKSQWIWLGLILGAGVSLAAQTAPEPAREVLFKPVKLDGPVHDPAKHTYWFGPFAECSSVLDINGDGKLDVAAGRNYYLAPNWTKVPDYRDGAATNGPDIDDNFEGSMDVNNDGRLDVLSSGWMLRQGIYWYENPGKAQQKWNSHEMLKADGLEGMVIGNLAGREAKDVLVNYYARRPGRSLIWFEHLDQAPWFKEHALGPENLGVSHGNGIGDINGDGRNDVVTTSGWFESPARPTTDAWTWHADWSFTAYGTQPKPGQNPAGAGLPILVADVNGDKMADVIMGSDHGYGLAWFQQKRENGKATFEQRWIETEYPSIHTMTLSDLDGDGQLDLIAGKQMFAHNGEDVGSYDPQFIFYYTFHGDRTERHIITYTPVAQYFGPDADPKRPPPTDIIGLGMRVNAADMDGDGRNDIIVAAKSGLYIFYNQGVATRVRASIPSFLPTRQSYPGNYMWDAPPPKPLPPSVR